MQCNPFFFIDRLFDVSQSFSIESFICFQSRRYFDPSSIQYLSLIFVFWNSTHACVIGIAGQSIVYSSFIPVTLIECSMTDFTSSSLLSALNPCNTALHSIGTFLVFFALSPWLHLESVVSFSMALILVSRPASCSSILVSICFSKSVPLNLAHHPTHVVLKLGCTPVNWIKNNNQMAPWWWWQSYKVGVPTRVQITHTRKHQRVMPHLFTTQCPRWTQAQLIQIPVSSWTWLFSLLVLHWVRIAPCFDFSFSQTFEYFSSSFCLPPCQQRLDLPSSLVSSS